MLAAINYHYIKNNFNQKYPSIFGLTPNQFEYQLKQLSKLGQFISINELHDIMQSKSLPHSNLLIITFDDGLKEQYELALPILNRLNIPAIFYVNTLPLIKKGLLDVHKIHLIRGIIHQKHLLEILEKKSKEFSIDTRLENIKIDTKDMYRYDDIETKKIKLLLNFIIPFKKRTKILKSIFKEEIGNEEEFLNIYMNEEDLKHLSNLGYLGNHGHSHLPLAKLSIQEQKDEISVSHNFFNQLLAKPLDTFSYPYGSPMATNGVHQQLKQYGYLTSFTMNRGINKLDNIDTLYLNRFDSNDVIGSPNPKSKILFNGF